MWMQSDANHSSGSLIAWLRQARRTDDSPLCDLLRSRAVNDSLSENQILEIAAIDLIEQRRQGRVVCVEQYLVQFPELTHSADYLLDLIDAEICVRREQSERFNASEYQARFPLLADRIERLFALELVESRIASWVSPHASSAVEPAVEAIAEELSDPSQGISFDEPGIAAAAQPRAASLIELDGQMLEPPEGVRVLNLTHSRPGVRLYRAIATNDRRPLAVKVIRQSQGGPLAPDDWMHRLEMASQQQHACLVTADSVIVCHHHYVLVRPWVEGLGWSEWSARNRPVRELLEPLLQLAETLEVLRVAGLSHGSVHPGNLMMDHHNRLVLLDLGSSAVNEQAMPWIWPVAAGYRPWIDSLPHRDVYSLAMLAIIMLQRRQQSLDLPLTYLLNDLSTFRDSPEQGRRHKSPNC